jgi:hypothetical protein
LSGNDRAKNSDRQAIDEVDERCKENETGNPPAKAGYTLLEVCSY